jgi:hypothetical protein
MHVAARPRSDSIVNIGRAMVSSMVRCLLGDPILYWAQRREDTFEQNHSDRFAKV